MTPTGPPPAAPLPKGALSVVLLGMPDAGKSSLLGALAQAAQTQERQLQGRLFDLWHGLSELQRRVYDETARETLEEIVPHPVRFEPLKAGKPDPEQRLEAVLVDCDGRVANEVLTGQRTLDDSTGGRLADAVVNADTLVLVVDSAATPEQIDHDLGEFVTFLRLFEQRRGRQSEVGGLPVFLVLSKCDLLAVPGEPQAAWTQRVEEKKNQVAARFKEFLDENDPGGFGSIDLTVLTTAVRRPPAAPAAPPSRDPVGVAELFRQVFAAARDFRSRAQKSQRRLAVTALGAAAVVVALVGGAVGLFLNHNAFTSSPLESAIEGYRGREGPTATDRLGEPLQRKISELDSFKKDPSFDKLSPELKEYVDQRLKELTAYRDFRDKVRAAPPSQFRSVERLTEYRSQLKTDVTPPAEYAAAWASTDAALLRDKWLADADALLAAATRLDDWYRGLRSEADRLLTGKLPWPTWADEVDKLVAKAESPPFKPTGKIPGSREMPNAAAAMYAPVFALDNIAASRRDWEAERAKVERLRDIAAAVGLLGDDERKAPLKLGDRFQSKQIAGRLALLKERYPKYAEWTADKIPEAPASDIRTAAQASYDRLMKLGQQMVLDELIRVSTDGTEKPEYWKAVARWLPESADLRDVNELSLVLQRLLSTNPEGPVPALETFLKATEFPVRLKSIYVEIPDESPGDAPARLTPTGALVVTDQDARFEFTPIGEPDRDARNGTTRYAFSRSGDAAFSFTPGQEFVIRLSVRSGADTRQLTWLRCRSQVYQIERLYRSPWLHAATETNPTRGEYWKEVTLSYSQDSVLPKVPDLLPVVKLRP